MGFALHPTRLIGKRAGLCDPVVLLLSVMIVGMSHLSL